MRSPSTELSHGVRSVELDGHVYDRDAVSGGYGVRPALLSEKLCVRRPQWTRDCCVLFDFTLVLEMVLMHIHVVSACAPLSSRREQNYKRSPYSGSSDRVRNVHLNGNVYYSNTVPGGFGVRPALFSEKLCVRRTQATRMVCAMSISTAGSAAIVQSQEVTACAPLSFRRNYAFAVLGVLV